MSQENRFRKTVAIIKYIYNNFESIKKLVELLPIFTSTVQTVEDISSMVESIARYGSMVSNKELAITEFEFLNTVKHKGIEEQITLVEERIAELNDDKVAWEISPAISTTELLGKNRALVSINTELIALMHKLGELKPNGQR